MNYKIMVKSPFTSARLLEQTGRLAKSKESDNHRVRRENVGNRLETLTGVKPEWNRRGYFYSAALTEEQAEEVSSWDMVRRVTED